MSTTLLDPQFLRKLDTLSLHTSRQVRAAVREKRRSRPLARGVEFADYRSYQIGDDYRHIDWSIYSRLDRLFIKLFSEEEDINVHLFVDMSGSMAWGSPRKLDYAARIAAAVGYIGLVNLDRVGAVAFADRVERLLPPRRGRGHIFRLFEFLHGLPTPAGGRSSLREAMWEYVHKTKRRGLLLIIRELPYSDGYEEGLQLGRDHRIDPFVIHVLRDDELVPARRGAARAGDPATPQ